MIKALSKWLQRLGLLSKASSPGLLFYGSDKDAFEAIAPLLKRFSKTAQRLEIYLCGSDADVCRWLERRFSNIEVVLAPFGVGLTATMFIRRLRIRTVILLEEEVFPSRAFLTSLKKRSVSVVLMSGRGLAHLYHHYPAEDGADLLLAVDREAKAATSIDSRLKLITTQSGRFDQEAVQAVLDDLVSLSGKNRKWISRRDRPLRRMFGRWLHRRLADPAFATRCRRFVRRYDDLGRIKRQLGNPETILCLGNGPSSEDRKLGKVAFDALFRVNHSWKNRSVLTKPDVVFTGGYSTFRALNAPMFGLQHQTGELTLLSTKGPWSFLHPLRYFSMERLGSYLDDFDWGQHRPTNGAAMIAMAVALKPKRLIIAGVDLFRHPEGSYPGDKTTPNAYTAAHNSDKELAFMFHHLDQLTGEVVIFGEILDREWRQHLERRQHLDEAG